MPASQDRSTGFRQTLARRGHAWFPCVSGNFTRDSGAQAMHRLLDENPTLDGVFVANDLMAQGALAALAEAGRRVPGDVAVVGFDDSSAALAGRPALTTVPHPLEDMAAESARLLLARIDDPGQRVTWDPGGCPGLQAGEESGFPRSGSGQADSPSGEPASGLASSEDSKR